MHITTGGFSMENDNTLYWFAATIRNAQWKKVGRRLAELDIRYYIPQTFNTLLFIHTTKATALSLVNSSTVSARYIIDHYTHTLLHVPQKQMEDFMRVMDLSPDAECMTQVPFRTGGRVRVIKGALNGVEGNIEELPEGLYLVVSVCSLLSAKVEIPKSYVIAID